jgi:hypothetical protein
VAVRTIFAMAEDCARGERLGWEEFVRDYSGITRGMLSHYFPALAPEIEEHVVAVYRRARANNNAFFQGMKFANERDFACTYRDFVFAYGREAARLPVPQISLEQVRGVMKDLAMVEQQVLWLFMRGFEEAQIAPILMHADATARSVREKAEERVRTIVPDASPDALVISARALMEAAEKGKTDACLPLKTFNNIVNGQVSWRERDVAEMHIASCFYCLDRFTTFQEMILLLKQQQKASEEATEKIVAQLDLPAKRKAGILTKILGR